MSWQRMKRLFKKKSPKIEAPLRSRCVAEGKYEVCNIIIKADTHAEAVNKYRKGFIDEK